MLQQPLALHQIALPKFSGNIYCVGRNYAEHAKELGNEVPSEPVLFLKAPSSLRSLKGSELAFSSESFHHELELCLLIGDKVMSKSELTPSCLAGLALGLDLTRRPVQDQLKKKGLPWCIAKSFQGSAILSHFVSAKGIDLQDIDLQLAVNGETRQAGHTRDMIFPCLSILSYLLDYAPLYPGDLIFTGTPSGVGPLKQGDLIRVSSQRLGLDEQGSL